MWKGRDGIYKISNLFSFFITMVLKQCKEDKQGSVWGCRIQIRMCTRRTGSGEGVGIGMDGRDNGNKKGIKGRETREKYCFPPLR